MLMDKNVIPVSGLSFELVHIEQYNVIQLLYNSSSEKSLGFFAYRRSSGVDWSRSRSSWYLYGFDIWEVICVDSSSEPGLKP